MTHGLVKARLSRLDTGDRMADSMLDAVETPAPDIADLLREPGAVALLVAYSRMPQGPARDRLVAFVESLSDQVKR